jgi:hypothetical protein
MGHAGFNRTDACVNSMANRESPARLLRRAHPVNPRSASGGHSFPPGFGKASARWIANGFLLPVFRLTPNYHHRTLPLMPVFIVLPDYNYFTLFFDKLTSADYRAVLIFTTRWARARHRARTGQW